MFVRVRQRVFQIQQMNLGSFRFVACLHALLFAGCLGSADNEVVIYSALDKEFSQPILKEIERELNITILPKFDVESNKTVGLVTELIQQQKRPRADIFWNNEVLHTVRLQNMGLLTKWKPAPAVSIPDNYKAADGSWTGFAARARVFLVNTDLIPDSHERPASFFDLADPQWSGKCGMAKPLFGTSATHAAVIFDRLGFEPASRWYQQFKSNAVIEGGNRQVAIKVGRGELAFGLTDTDDAMLEVDKGNPVVIVYPDQRDSESGTLLIPNTICLIANGPNTQRAQQVVERLLQSDIETRLATGTSAQFPLNPSILVASRANPPPTLKEMNADFESAATKWDQVLQELARIFK
jgi:iron(III) transport system substrate-binding protein